MPNINLSGSRLIKRPGDVREQPTPNYNEIELQKRDIQNALSGVLSDGVISNDEIVRLAKLDFTVEDVQNAFNSSIWYDFSDDDKQKLTDNLMTRIETYRQLNQEREGEEPTQFGL